MTMTVAVLALAACGGGGQSTASAKQEITTTWEAFFSASASNINQLQNATKLQKVYQAGRENPQTKALSAKVSRVDRLTSSGCKNVYIASPCAKVTYDLLASGAPVLPNATGYATKQNGKWKVSQSTFCSLVALGNNNQLPPDCA